MASDGDQLDEREKLAVAAIHRAFELGKADTNSDTSSGKHADGDKTEAATLLQRKFRDKQQRAGQSAGHSETARANWTKGGTLVKRLAGESGTGIHTDGPDPSERGLARSASGPKAALASFKQNKNATLAERVKLAKEYAYNRDRQSGHRKAYGGGQKAVKVKKKLEEQHWLEMIDEKHRYGSNLKYYFEEWQARSDTKGNFLEWLDHGDGHNVDLPECSREKLDKECILYLDQQQRRNYLVEINSKDGKLCWAYPTKLAVEYAGSLHPTVDTTGRQWTDMGNGQGIGPTEMVLKDRPNDQEQQSLAHRDDGSSDTSAHSESDTSSSSSASSVSSDEWRPTALRRTSSEVFQPLSSEAPGSADNSQESKDARQKTEKGDVWIYVSDERFRIYCGIKQKGHFQHSSFLSGGPITSAGTMIIRDGVLIKCNPMSGHYRTKASYFKRFIEELEAQGADLSQVKVGQTELKLWFTERANTLHSMKGKMRRLKKQVQKNLNL